MAQEEAALEVRALLSRHAGHDADPYERAMRACLATAQTSLAACPSGPLLDRLTMELGELARNCERDAREADQRHEARPDATSRAEAQAARRVARAARDLSELARAKALAGR